MARMSEALAHAVFVERRGRYAFLVMLLADVFVVPPLVSIGAIPSWTQAVSFSLTAAVAVVALSRHETLRGLVIFVAVMSALGRWIPFASSTVHFYLLDAVGVAIAAATFAALLLSDVFSRSRIPDRLLAVLLVYILAGFTWAYAYSAIDLVSPGALTFPGKQRFVSEYIYFSFCTLTTVGYGDIVPVHPVARMLAVLEAMAGSLYLVVVVARFVGEKVSDPPAPAGKGR